MFGGRMLHGGVRPTAWACQTDPVARLAAKARPYHGVLDQRLPWQ